MSASGRSPAASATSAVAGPVASPAVGYGAAIVAASLFAWLGPLSRWAYERGMEPLPFVAWRAGIGAAVLVAIVAVLARRHGRALVRPGDLRPSELTALGVACVAALTLNLAIFGAFERVPVAIALIGFYTYPAMVAAVAIALRRDEPSPAVVGSLVLALAGMVAVVAGTVDPSGGLAVDPVGILLALGAAASQTVFVTVSRDGYSRVPSEQASTIILGSTLVACVVIGLAAGLGPALAAPLARPDALPVVIAAGTAGAGIPSLLFLTAIRRIGGTRAGILMLLEPVIAVGLAAWLLGEALRPVQVAGALAVLAAALLLQRAHRPLAARPGAEPPSVVAAHETVPGPPPTR